MGYFVYDNFIVSDRVSSIIYFRCRDPKIEPWFVRYYFCRYHDSKFYFIYMLSLGILDEIRIFASNLHLLYDKLHTFMLPILVSLRARFGFSLVSHFFKVNFSSAFLFVEIYTVLSRTEFSKYYRVFKKFESLLNDIFSELYYFYFIR